MGRPAKQSPMVAPLHKQFIIFTLALLVHEASHFIIYLLNPNVRVVGLVLYGIEWRWDINQITFIPLLGGITHFGEETHLEWDLLALIFPIITVGIMYQKTHQPSILFMLLIAVRDYGAILNYVL